MPNGEKPVKKLTHCGMCGIWSYCSYINFWICRDCAEGSYEKKKLKKGVNNGDSNAR